MKTIMMIPNSSAMTRLSFEIFRRSVAKPVGPVLAASFFFAHRRPAQRVSIQCK